MDLEQCNRGRGVEKGRRNTMRVKKSHWGGSFTIRNERNFLGFTIFREKKARIMKGWFCGPLQKKGKANPW